MGANFSTWRGGHKSPVVTFHSTRKWKVHLEESKGTNKLMVIDFSASWCGPCQYMEPVIEEFATKFPEVEFIKIDVDELADVAQEFGILSMPTFVLMKNGREVDQIVGADREQLEMKIYKYRV